MRCARRAIAGALVALVALMCGPASAHTPSTAHLRIEAASDDPVLSVELDLSVRDLALSFALDADADGRVTWQELVARRAAIEARVLGELQVLDGGQACPLEPAALRVREYERGMYAALSLRARCAKVPRAIVVNYGLLFAEDPQHRALVEVHGPGTFRLGIATTHDRVLAFAPEVDAKPAFRAFLAEGVGHILEGYDHLAFLLLLVLPIGLAYTGGRWRPEPGPRRKAMKAVGLVTAFTAAHSITLSLAALGVLALPQGPVEILIAATVVLAAANNVRPIVTRYVWPIAFGFGLLHGFGFAGALDELGLPRDGVLAALLGFNLGVELGQIAVLAVALPILHVLQRWRGYAPVIVRAASFVVGAVGVFWLIERIPG